MLRWCRRPGPPSNTRQRLRYRRPRWRSDRAGQADGLPRRLASCGGAHRGQAHPGAPAKSSTGRTRHRAEGDRTGPRCSASSSPPSDDARRNGDRVGASGRYRPRRWRSACGQAATADGSSAARWCHVREPFTRPTFRFQDSNRRAGTRSGPCGRVRSPRRSRSASESVSISSFRGPRPVARTRARHRSRTSVAI